MTQKSNPIDECPKCHSSYFYTRKKDKTRVCRKCGHEWPIKGDKK